MTAGLTDEDRDGGREAFASYARPAVAKLLHALALDVVYHRGSGDRLYFRDDAGREIEVLDFLGGYGASLLGHNHPELVARARAVLDEERPFNAQASSRGLAGMFARRLAQAVGRVTGRRYVVTLANSGAEVVEAAIKHAELEAHERAEALFRDRAALFRRVRAGLRDGSVTVEDALFDQAAAAFGAVSLNGIEDLFARVLEAARTAAHRAPRLLALEQSFHGKTTGALQLTANLRYRGPWARLGGHTVFIPIGDHQALGAAVEAARVHFPDLEIGEGGVLRLARRSLVNIVACIAEPIQGEGGIREVPASFLASLRGAADSGGFPLILDEIQAGLGRTGTFLASAPSGVRGDYYLFAKGLGGGLAKTGALVVDEARYVRSFGYTHSSTFADDDHGAAVAIGVLDLLERDGGSVITGCAERGAHLLRGLRELQARYPELVADVRGRGLMVGLQLRPPLASSSPLLRALGEQHLLSYLVVGYLLHEHQIRVAPTLSAEATLRFEPSAFISIADLDRCCAALDEALAALRAADVHALTRHLTGAPRRAAPPPAAPFPDRVTTSTQPPRGAARVAFLIHFFEPGDLRNLEPGLADVDDAGCVRFLERTRGLLGPFVADRVSVRSGRGEEVHLSVIGLAFTPEQIIASMATGDESWALELLQQAIELARRLGCSVVGFGGYTSIVSRGCAALIEDQLALTSGNSLTTAAAVEALVAAARRISGGVRRLGIVGAAGNIGAVLAEVAGDDADAMVLVGRAGSRGRLEATARAVYRAAFARLRRGEDGKGLSKVLAGTRTAARLLADPRAGDPGDALWDGLAKELGPAAPLRVEFDLRAFRDCDAIVAATNSPRPVILPEHVGDGPVVICDVAVPGDVSPEVQTARPNALILRGGLVKLPAGQSLDVRALRMPDGQVYGCLAETLLLGFAGIRDHFSYGPLTAAHVRRARALAAEYGFTIEEQRFDRGTK